ncbi:FAD-dependent oxidoreductase-like enzyme [Cordyceps militaris]|uniref:FAD-dependent oxidoreductase-like enzyme n=1 Tax=Cordyceps militaris TaxID=73501 RepID=A0A2H4SLF8_CORMI|nr:FAD-dependent oxidoreductase-like enzyme [Cordyceps militaris]
MAARPATDRQQQRRTSPPAPTTPMDHVQDVLSQVTLPSTEGPGSPMDPNSSFKTEINDDRPSAMVIPSSLTPPPSSQLPAAANRRNMTFSQSQLTAPVSPPATILNALRDRPISSIYSPPTAEQISDASADQLREMLHTCIAENHKFKMETAHHKLQLKLQTLQADEESKRAAVEHDMVRRQVDILCLAEHSRHAKREFGSPSDAITSKYLDLKASYEAAQEEIDSLHRRVRAAKKVIQQKEDETTSLADERDVLINRIRENREHFHSLCSPGGIFHGALTPRQSSHIPQARNSARAHGTENQHGLSMILQAMNQDNQNNSAPSTPAPLPRTTPRQNRMHSRNAQSMSSLPTTPINNPRGAHSGLLPSAHLVPQTEPRYMYTQKYFEPVTPDRRYGRKSRESTISADESENTAAALRATDPRTNVSMRSQVDVANETDVFSSQASQAAADLLRRHPGQSLDVASSGDSRDGSPIQLPVKPVLAKARSRLPDSSRSEKRRLSGSDAEAAAAKSRREHGSPAKKARTGVDADGRRVGLGIQYQ